MATSAEAVNALIGELYQGLSMANARIAQLEAENAELRGADGKTPGEPKDN
jgi:hypothetical protein